MVKNSRLELKLVITRQQRPESKQITNDLSQRLMLGRFVDAEEKDMEDAAVIGPLFTRTLSLSL